jgi:hypothetical protein
MQFLDSEGAIVRTASEKIEKFLLALGWEKGKTIQCNETEYEFNDIKFSTLLIDNSMLYLKVDMNHRVSIEFAKKIAQQFALSSVKIAFQDLILDAKRTFN